MFWNYCDFQKWIKSGCEEVEVKTLSLVGNKLETIPDSICLLTSLHTLRVLILNDNQLTTLPDSISALTNLRRLYLNVNSLTTLPDSISLLTSLRELNLNENNISTLPDSISFLTNLETLSLSENMLTTLHPCLGNLRQLRNFYYGGNPLEYIPANVMRMIIRTDTVQRVYGDSQSVHNSTIQKSLLDSVNRLLAIPIPRGNVINSILEDSILSNETKARPE